VEATGGVSTPGRTSPKPEGDPRRGTEDRRGRKGKRSTPGGGRCKRGGTHEEGGPPLARRLNRRIGGTAMHKSSEGMLDTNGVDTQIPSGYRPRTRATRGSAGEGVWVLDRARRRKTEYFRGIRRRVEKKLLRQSGEANRAGKGAPGLVGNVK